MTTLKTVFADMAPLTPLPGIALRRVMGDQAMIQHAEVAAGAAVPGHSHPNEQFTLVLSGRLRLRLGENAAAGTYELGPGEVLRIPGGMHHEGEAIEDCVVIDVFAPPSETTGIDAPGA
ncbi:MAG: cupin domain-containing protein [Pseudomonadota bacterium]|nr:cupin domain-containing protein [Pseudomonadota bacterium]MEE3098864.1 cupin domain-containing protein [Pseudomonadota bacterium]